MSVFFHDISSASDALLKELLDNIRSALQSDDADPRPPGGKPYNVRATGDWKRMASDLEAELRRRGAAFTPIEW